MQRPLPFILLTASALLVACDTLAGPTEGESQVPLQTDRLEYTLSRTDIGLEVELPFVYTNMTGEAVYVVNCNRSAPPILEKQINGRWQMAWAGVALLCLSPPIVIEAGETYTDTLRVFAGPPATNYYPQFIVEKVEGTYRMVWHRVVHNYDEARQGFGDELALEERISNTFTLSVE